MDEGFFKLKGKTLVIIDWANVYGWFKKLKWEISPKKLYDYLKNYPEIFDIRFYFGVERGNRKSEEFQKQIKDIGYNLISKQVKWVPVSLETSHFKSLIKELLNFLGGVKNINPEILNNVYKLAQKTIFRRKCDFDCEISLDFLNNSDSFDGVILFSGDGDYAVIVNELIKRRKQIIVVFAKGCKGREYEDFKKGLYLCSVKKLKKQISR